MKKAEIIKNGNVNLEPIKLKRGQKTSKFTHVDWDDIYLDFGVWKMNVRENSGSQPTPTDCFFWLKERLS